MAKRKKQKKKRPIDGSRGPTIADINGQESEVPITKKTETEGDSSTPVTDDLTKEAAAAQLSPDGQESIGEASPKDRKRRSLDMEIEDLTSQLSRLNADYEEIRDLVRRKQAEFENFRKRVERERSEMGRRAAASVVKDMLPVLDNLERAVEASSSAPEDQLREGVEIIYRQFRDVLEKQGLEQFVALHQQFDPHVHEAVGSVETLDHPEGTVLEVLQPGYMFNDRLLRPAMVNVARASDKTDEGEVPPSDSRNVEESS